MIAFMVSFWALIRNRLSVLTERGFGKARAPSNEPTSFSSFVDPELIAGSVLTNQRQ